MLSSQPNGVPLTYNCECLQQNFNTIECMHSSLVSDIVKFCPNTKCNWEFELSAGENVIEREGERIRIEEEWEPLLERRERETESVCVRESGRDREREL